MEIKVKTQDGRNLSFRASQKFESAQGMLEAFVEIHRESIALGGWDVSVDAPTGDSSPVKPSETSLV